MISRKLIEDSVTAALLDDYLRRRLGKHGYSRMELHRTLLGTQILIYAERPGLIIGSEGRLVNQLTQELQQKFKLENPQIEVRQVSNPELDPFLVANGIAGLIERGWHFRRACYFMLDRVMQAGAKGCEIVISGKLTGPRARFEKFRAGIALHSGHPASKLLRASTQLLLKPGVLGIQVSILPPDALPEGVRMREPSQNQAEESKHDQA